MKKWLGIGMTLVMLATAAVPAVAADIQKGKAEIRPDFTIVIDDQEMNFKRADGSAAYALVYKDTTYLPLRAIGEALDKNVNWDEDTKTITLSGDREKKDSSNKYISGKTKTVTVQVRPDFTIVLDGKELEFKTASGRKVYPLLYDGSTYLPLRAIGEIMDMDVDWDQDDKTVTLTDNDDDDADSTVTDADSFKDSDKDVDKDDASGNDIGMGNAKKIALEDAELDAKDVKFIQTKMERENGKKQYDIEFYYNGVEYDYEIDAATGKILDKDDEAEGWKADKYDDDWKHDWDHDDDDDDDIDEDFSVYPKNIISKDKATSIALNHADLRAKEVSNLEVDLDDDDGAVIYEVEFEKGDTEYKYEINAKTGKILDFEKEIDD